MGAAVVRSSAAHAIEIDCARRDREGRVTHVGGPGTGGRRWMARIEIVVAAAKADEVRYFISRSPQQLGLQVRDGELVTMIEDGWTVRQLPVCRS
ncbi:MAG TPA: hypothetical protein VM183_18140 [Burkholderiales bacterium]|nr:hypothetical protein [Burkholderiales bacterium]